VRATRFNHVSVHALDLDESLRFYVDVFGMERLPSPNFSAQVEWLRVGEQQLHLFKSENPAYSLDDETFGAAVRELPDGARADVHPRSGWIDSNIELSRPPSSHPRGRRFEPARSI
jgi:catechol 2,3-dioxygenase-like lactoylglutathione lyase family enzyme